MTYKQIKDTNSKEEEEKKNVIVTENWAILHSTSDIYTLYKSYNIVLCIEMSPSMFTVDPLTNQIKYDLLIESLPTFISSLLLPIHYGKNDSFFFPTISISLLYIENYTETKILLHNLLLTNNNVQNVINDLIEFLETKRKQYKFSIDLNIFSYCIETEIQNQETFLPQLVSSSLLLFQDMNIKSCSSILLLTAGGFPVDVYHDRKVMLSLLQKDIPLNIFTISSSSPDLYTSYASMNFDDTYKYITKFTSGVYSSLSFLYMNHSSNNSQPTTEEKADGLNESSFYVNAQHHYTNNSSSYNHSTHLCLAHSNKDIYTISHSSEVLFFFLLLRSRRTTNIQSLLCCF